MSSNLAKKSASIRAERGREHGSVRQGFTSLGMGITAILREHYQLDLPVLPPHVASLICAELKLQRCARSIRYNPDNYVDGKNYLDFAYELSGEDHARQRRSEILRQDGRQQKRTRRRSS